MFAESSGFSIFALPKILLKKPFSGKYKLENSIQWQITNHPFKGYATAKVNEYVIVIRLKLFGMLLKISEK